MLIRVFTLNNFYFEIRICYPVNGCCLGLDPFWVIWDFHLAAEPHSHETARINLTYEGKVRFYFFGVVRSEITLFT